MLAFAARCSASVLEQNPVIMSEESSVGQTKVKSLGLNLRLHRKTGTLFRFPNAFAASALMMALSTLLVTMHVDFVIQLGSFSTS